MDNTAPRFLNRKPKEKYMNNETQTAPQTGMEVGDAWLQVNELGSNVALKRITPAEAAIYRTQFGIKVAGQSKPTNPLTHLDIDVARIQRSDSDEYARLARKFGDKLIKEAFPGVNPKMPKTFVEVDLHDKDEKGQIVPLPKAPDKGKEIVIEPLAKLKPDNGADIEPASNAAQQIADLTKQVAELTKLVAAANAPKK